MKLKIFPKWLTCKNELKWKASSFWASAEDFLKKISWSESISIMFVNYRSMNNLKFSFSIAFRVVSTVIRRCLDNFLEDDIFYKKFGEVNSHFWTCDKITANTNRDSIHVERKKITYKLLYVCLYNFITSSSIVSPQFSIYIANVIFSSRSCLLQMLMFNE